MEENSGPGVVQPIPSSGFSKFVSYLSKVVDPISGKWGAAVAAIMLAAMMFLTFADVASANIGKWALISSHTSIFKPILGSQEITELMMVILASFAVAYCAIKKGHIRVDLILQYTSRKATLWFDIFTYGISFIFYILLAWQGWLNAVDNIDISAVTTILEIDVPPFNILLVIGCALAALVFLRDFLKSIEEVIK